MKMLRLQIFCYRANIYGDTPQASAPGGPQWQAGDSARASALKVRENACLFCLLLYRLSHLHIKALLTAPVSSRPMHPPYAC